MPFKKGNNRFHNTKFQKRMGKLWTYSYANNTKAQIDYIFINKKWNNSALNSETYSSFEGVSSDHRIIMAKIQLSLRRNAARTTTTVHYDGFLLNNRDIRDKYTWTLRNKFDALQEISETPTPNDEYENFVNAQLEAAAECIPTKQRAKSRIPWGILVVRKKRADVKTASLRNRRNPTNINTQKLKTPRNESSNVYLKEQTETAKLKAASPEERIHMWKQHFENLLRNPLKVTDEPVPQNY